MTLQLQARPDTLAAPARLHEFFERQADEQPTAAAVLIVQPDQTVHPGNLRGAGRRRQPLARCLRLRFGIRTNDRVALLLPRGSREAYTAVLAVLKAGAAYVPLDLEYPTERITDILTDSGARVLLCNHRSLAGADLRNSPGRPCGSTNRRNAPPSPRKAPGACPRGRSAGSRTTCAI